MTLIDGDHCAGTHILQPGLLFGSKGRGHDLYPEISARRHPRTGQGHAEYHTVGVQGWLDREDADNRAVRAHIELLHTELHGVSTCIHGSLETRVTSRRSHDFDAFIYHSENEV